MIWVCLGSCLFRSITQPDHFNYFDSRRRERLGRSDGGQSRGWVRRVQGLAQPDRQLHQRPRVPVHRHRRRNWRRRNRAGGKDAAYGCSSVDLYLSIDAESHLLLLLNIVLEGRASIINWSEPDLGHLLVCCELSPLPSEFKEGGRLKKLCCPPATCTSENDIEFQRHLFNLLSIVFRYLKYFLCCPLPPFPPT